MWASRHKGKFLPVTGALSQWEEREMRMEEPAELREPGIMSSGV